MADDPEMHLIHIDEFALVHREGQGMMLLLNFSLLVVYTMIA